MDTSAPATAKTCVQVLLDNAALADERGYPQVGDAFRAKAALGEKTARNFISKLGILDDLIKLVARPL